MRKQGTQKDWVETPLAHTVDHTFKSDRRQRFDTQPLKPGGIGGISLFQLHGACPIRWPIPAGAYEPDASKLFSDSFNGFKNPQHWFPTEFTVSDIHHIELATLQLQGPFPRRVVGVKEKRNNARPQRVQCWLAYLVGNAVARIDPAPARSAVGMVVVAGD